MSFVRRFFEKPYAGRLRAAACILAGAALAVAVFAPAAFANEPHPWQLGMQPAATPVKEAIHSLHNELLVIITLITLFVLGLLLYVIWRFNEKRNPVPSRTTHHTVIEVAWTVIPVVILVIIAIPSFKLLYFMDRIPDADMTIKVTGHQWYWSYEYPDSDGLAFDSNIVPEDQLKGEDKRHWLLEADNHLVVPVNTKIRILIAGTDVMHSWFVPALGVQNYAVIGKLNEAWMNIEREGIFYGQCNQICGVNHAFMPIEVEAVSKDRYKQWLVEAKKKFASTDGAPVRVAAAPAE